MRKSWKKRIAVAAAAVMALAAGNPAVVMAGSQEQTTLTVWAWDEYYNVAIMKKAAEMYEKDHPEVKIEVVDVAAPDIEMKLHANLSVGTLEGLPDICLIMDMSYQKFLTTYSESFLDTTDYFPYDELTESKIDYVTYEGRQYGLPFDSGVGGTYYRTDYLEKAGISPDRLNNITWKEYIEIGKELKEKTGISMLGVDTQGVGGLIREELLPTAGVGIYDEEGNLHIKDNEALKVSFETAKELFDSGIGLPVNGWDEGVAAVNNGEIASVVSGGWYMGTIKQAEDQSGKWGLCSAPRLDYEGSTNALDTTGCSWALFEGKENNEAAIEFLKTMYTGNKEFYGSILVNQGAICSWLPSYDIPEYELPDEFFGNQPVFKILADMIPDVKVIDLGGYYTELSDAIGQAFMDYLDGNIDVDTALQNTEDIFISLVGN